MKKRSDIPNQQVIFTFDGLEAVVLHLASVSDEVLEQAQYHGFEARIGDNAAIARKQPDGTVIVVTEAMRRDAVKSLVDHYETGTKVWNVKAAPAQNPIIAQIATKRGCTYAEAEAFLANQFLGEME